VDQSLSKKTQNTGLLHTYLNRISQSEL